MKTKNTLRFAIGLATTICSANIFASSGTYHFDLNTASLVGNPNAPFVLDFQLNDSGDLIQNTTVLINNFNFSGVGSATTFGGVTGDFSSSILLTDSDFSNEFFQEFTPGGTISFDLFITSMADALMPDGFTFGVGTVAPSSFFDVFAQIELNNDQQTLVTQSPQDGVTLAARVPDTGAAAALPIALAGLGLFGFFVRGRQNRLVA